MDRCEQRDCYITLKVEALDSLSKVLCEEDTSLAAALHVILDRVAPEVQRIIAGKNSVNAVSLANLVKDILIHLHLRQTSLTRSSTFKYWDYVSALLSILLDLKLLLVHVSESRKELRRAVLDLCFHLNFNRHQVWDAIVHARCMKKKFLTQYLPEVIEKLGSWCRQKCDDPTLYFKFVVVVSSIAKCKKVDDDQRKRLKKALASFETKFDFREWFFCQSFSNVVPPETCPTAKKLLKLFFEGNLTRHQLHSMCASLQSVAAINADLWRDDSDMFFIDNRRESVSTDATSSMDALEGSLKSLETPDDDSNSLIDDIVDSETVSSSSELAEDPVVFLESYLLNTQAAEKQTTSEGGGGTAALPLVLTPNEERDNGSSDQTTVDELNTVWEQVNGATLRAGTKKAKKRKVSSTSGRHKYGERSGKVSDSVVHNEAMDQLREDDVTESSGAQNEHVASSPSHQTVTKKERKRMTSFVSDVDNDITCDVGVGHILHYDTAEREKTEMHDGISDSHAATTDPHRVTTKKKRRLSSRSDLQGHNESDTEAVCAGVINRRSEDDTKDHKNTAAHGTDTQDTPVMELPAQGGAPKNDKQDGTASSGSEMLQQGCSDESSTQVFCALEEDDSTKKGNEEEEELFEASDSPVVELSPELGEEGRRNRVSIIYDARSKGDEEHGGTVHTEAVDDPDEEDGVNPKSDTEEMLILKDDDFIVQRCQEDAPQKRKRNRTPSCGSDKQKQVKLVDGSELEEHEEAYRSSGAQGDHSETSEITSHRERESDRECFYGPDAMQEKQNEAESNFIEFAVVSQGYPATDCNTNPSASRGVVATEKAGLNTAHKYKGDNNGVLCDEDAPRVNNDNEENLSESSGHDALETSISDTETVAQDSDHEDESCMTRPPLEDVSSKVREKGAHTVSPDKLGEKNDKTEDSLGRKTIALRRSTRLRRTSEARVEGGQESNSNAAKDGRNTPQPRTSPLIERNVSEALSDTQDRSGISNQEDGRQDPEDIREQMSRDEDGGCDQPNGAAQGKDEPKQRCLSNPVWTREMTQGAHITEGRMPSDRDVPSASLGTDNRDSPVKTTTGDSDGLANSSSVEDSGSTTNPTNLQMCEGVDSEGEGSSVPVSQLRLVSRRTPRESASREGGEYAQSAAQGSGAEDGGELTQICAVIGYDREDVAGLPQKKNAEVVSVTTLRPRSSRRSAAAARTKMEEVYRKLSQRSRFNSSPESTTTADVEGTAADILEGGEEESENDSSPCRTRAAAKRTPSMPEGSNSETPAKVQGNVKRATLTPESKVLLTRLDQLISSPAQPENITGPRTKPEKATVAKVNSKRTLFSKVPKSPAVDSVSASSADNSTLCAVCLSKTVSINGTPTQDPSATVDGGGAQEQNLANQMAGPSTLTSTASTPTKQMSSSTQLTTPVTRQSRLNETPSASTCTTCTPTKQMSSSTQVTTPVTRRSRLSETPSASTSTTTSPTKQMSSSTQVTTPVTRRSKLSETPSASTCTPSTPTKRLGLSVQVRTPVTRLSRLSETSAAITVGPETVGREKGKPEKCLQTPRRESARLKALTPGPKTRRHL
ncbi:uncharacterized protein LOC135390640 [Ornithodoros turicata]|uniref:uncharacterized protein LOC135390640 n=1 Tax=Ornithodoros turicata TaxID=34597 RepID=UPI0031390AB2